MTLRYEPSSEPLLISVKQLFFLPEKTHLTKRPANRMVEFEGFRWGVLREQLYNTRGLEVNCAKQVDLKSKFRNPPCGYEHTGTGVPRS